MRNKIIVIALIVFVCITIAYAANVKWTALSALTTVNDADILCIIDDVAGTPTSKKITVLDLFDTVDTFSELNTITADKTLVNEEDAVAWDALGTFGLGITITTGDPLTLGANRIDNGSDLLDGEMIGADTIDDDSIDLSTGAGLSAADMPNEDVGDISISSGSWTLDVNTVASAELADGDYGDIDIASGAVTLDTDSVADNEIDYSNVTFADFDYETNWKMWHSNGSGDVTEITLGANGTFLESNGAAAAPAFRVLADGDVPNDITVDLATLATTLTITDNESTAENNPIVFVAGADPDGGNLGLETDGDAHYNPSTGTVTATQFVGGGAGLTSVDAATGDSATAFFDAGTIEHEYGGLEADINAYTGLVAITGGATAEVDSKSELEGHIADVANFAEADGDVFTGNHDFGGADLELPQGQTPDTDGDIDLDFTDGSVVIQHGSAHAELEAATDVVVGKLIRSFSATLATPDSLQSEIDQWPLKSIESSEFPHGIVITDIYLKTSASSTYAVNVENWDDPTTINGANGTIDAITTSASTEVHEDTITYSTIGAGQIIMLDLPTTDISWITITIEYYEPIS